MTRPPSVKQLHNLVDRADRGRLTPDEVARLRQGITVFDARRRHREWAQGSWAEEIRALRERLNALHAPMTRGGFMICAHCSGWDGRRCLGLLTDWPCETLHALDAEFPEDQRGKTA